MGIGKFHGTMMPDDSERLIEGDVDAAGDRDLATGVAFGSPGVVVQDVADVAGFPARVGDGVPGVGDLELGQLFDVRVDDLGETAKQPGAVGGGDLLPRRQRPSAATLDGSIGLVDVVHGDRGDAFFGGGVDDAGGTAHSRSNPR